MQVFGDEAKRGNTESSKHGFHPEHASGSWCHSSQLREIEVDKSSEVDLCYEKHGLQEQIGLEQEKALNDRKIGLGGHDYQFKAERKDHTVVESESNRKSGVTRLTLADICSGDEFSESVKRKTTFCGVEDQQYLHESPRSISQFDPTHGIRGGVYVKASLELGRTHGAACDEHHFEQDRDDFLRRNYGELENTRGRRLNTQSQHSENKETSAMHDDRIKLIAKRLGKRMRSENAHLRPDSTFANKQRKYSGDECSVDMYRSVPTRKHVVLEQVKTRPRAFDGLDDHILRPSNDSAKDSQRGRELAHSGWQTKVVASPLLNISKKSNLLTPMLSIPRRNQSGVNVPEITIEQQNHVLQEAINVLKWEEQSSPGDLYEAKPPSLRSLGKYFPKQQSEIALYGKQTIPRLYSDSNEVATGRKADKAKQLFQLQRTGGLRSLDR